jgi:hypothetical protein
MAGEFAAGEDGEEEAEVKAKPPGLNDRDWVWVQRMLEDWELGIGRHSHHYAAALKANWVAGVKYAPYWAIIRENVRKAAFDE